MVFEDFGLTREKKRRSDALGYWKEDRRVSFTRNEMTDLAGVNVADSGIEMQIFIDLTAELIRSFSAKRPTKIWRKLRIVARQMRQRQFEAAACRAPIWDGESSSLIAHLEVQVSPSANHAIIGGLQNVLGLYSPYALAEAILALPRALRQPLVALDKEDVRSALAASIVYPQSVEPLFKAIWKMRTVAVAQRRITALSAAAQTPYGYGVSSPQLWPSAGYLFQRTVTAPATVIQSIVALLPTLALDGDDEAAIGILVAHGLLSDRHAPVLLGAGRTIRARLDANKGMTIDVLNCLRHCAEACRPAALLVNGDMKRDGLDREEPIDRLLGLTGAEATAFIAEQLLLACMAIDVAPAYDSIARKARPAVFALPPIDQVGFVGNILAHEAPSYRYASGTRGVRNARSHDPLDPEHHPMRAAVIGMRKRMELEGRRGRFVASFGIDPYDCLD